MSVILHEAVVSALREAHAAFMEGKNGEYREHLEEARAGIEAIRSLGEEMDGSTGRPFEVLTLQGELALVSALTELRSPEKLIAEYELAELSLVGMFRSKVLTKSDPFLPPVGSLYDFYGARGAEAEELARTLTAATGLYSRLTGGGAGGVAELYRAELSARRGEKESAAEHAKKALAAMTGDRWIEPLARRLLKNESEGKAV